MAIKDVIAETGSDDMKAMREYFLTPTMSLDDPLEEAMPPGLSKRRGRDKESSAKKGGSRPAGQISDASYDEDDEDDEDDEKFITLHERMVQHIKAGDPAVVILLAFVLYLASLRFAEHLPTILACLVTLYGSREYYRRRLRKTARKMKQVQRSALAWTPISPVETANWMNWTASSLWIEILRPKLTEDLKHQVARQLKVTKLPWFIASAAVKQVNLGDEPPKIGNFQVLKNRYGRQVCEADMAFDAKDMSIVVRLTLRMHNTVLKLMTNGDVAVDVKVGNLMVEGRVRYFPLNGHPLLIGTFTQMPKVRFDVGAAGISLTAIPRIKQFMGDVISEALGRKLLFPYGQQIELGKRANIKPPEVGTIELKFKHLDLWEGFGANRLQKPGSCKNAKKRGISPSGRGSLEGTGGVGEAGGSGEFSFLDFEDADEIDLECTKLEVLVGSSKPLPVAVMDGTKAALNQARPPGMPDLVLRLESLDKDAVLRIPVTPGNSRVHINLRHAGYLVQGAFMFQWCTRTCMTHAWYAAPIPDRKTDSMRFSNAENRLVVLGLHVQKGALHNVVGLCEMDIKFRWGPHRKLDSMSSLKSSASSIIRTSTDSKMTGSPLTPTTVMRQALNKGLQTVEHAMEEMAEGAEKLMGGKSMKGMLQVDVVQAKDLPPRDASGTSDPYVVVWFNKQKAKTAVRAVTLTPVWEHRMIFKVLGEENQKLVLKVYDHDSMSWVDDFLGTAEVDLAKFLDGELHNEWVTLVAVESGKIRLRIKYFPGVTSAPKSGWDVEELIDAEEAEQIESMSWGQCGAQHVASFMSTKVKAQEGVLVVTLKSGEDLVKADVLTGSSDPYCILRCGSSNCKSAIKYVTLNPRWDQTFEFAVSPIQRLTGRLLIECRDHDLLSEDDFLGTVTVELNEVPDDGVKQALSLPLEGVPHGIVNVDVKFVPTGKEVDITKLAEQSASTQSIKSYKMHSAGKKLLTKPQVDDGGGCFGGCFSSPRKDRGVDRGVSNPHLSRSQKGAASQKGGATAAKED